MSDIPVMKKIIGTKDFYIINNKYYIVVKDMACRSCAFRKGLDNCIVYNKNFQFCYSSLLIKIYSSKHRKMEVNLNY